MSKRKRTRRRKRPPVSTPAGRRLVVTAEHRNPPDLERFAAALLALVLKELEADEEADG